MSLLQAGEDSESEDEDQTFDAVPASADASENPSAQASEDECDSEDDEEGGGDVSGIKSNSKEKTKNKNITWRHKALRMRNRQMRKAYLSRLCTQPKVISSKLRDLGQQIRKQQASAQDVSDSLQVLRDDMSVVHEKLVMVLENVDFIPRLHVPCCIIDGKTMDEVKEHLSALPRMDFVSTEWQDFVFKVTYKNMRVSSQLHFRLSSPEFGDLRVEVVEIHRQVTMVHSPFFHKMRAVILKHLNKLSVNPLIFPEVDTPPAVVST
eukprot:m.144355 g.144355  ORF g.144355 m.144355 type:complete len:265 (-) comp17710_c0_seq2:955-1749(-)